MPKQIATFLNIGKYRLATVSCPNLDSAFVNAGADIITLKQAK